MKTIPILLPFLLGTIAACASTKHAELEGRRNMWVLEAMRNASLNNAIIAQHTLYPYHFANGSAELNDLGERDLNVLAGHFLESAGDLNVRRGEAAQGLYESRVKTVLERLAAAGVSEGAVAVKDGPAGGDGLSSERVIVILKEKMSKSSSMIGGSGSGSSTGGGGARLIQ